MNDTFVVTAAFVVLLVLEWRYRRRSLRMATALLALAALFYFQPNYTWARRKALGTPPAERVILDPVAGSRSDTLSGYYSGVYTTMRWVEYYDDVGAGARRVAIGALVWLACRPTPRTWRGHGGGRRTPTSDSIAREA